MCVEEISKCALGTVTSRGGSSAAYCLVSGARPITVTRSTSMVSPLLITSRATTFVTSGAGSWPGMPGGDGGGGGGVLQGRTVERRLRDPVRRLG